RSFDFDSTGRPFKAQHGIATIRYSHDTLDRLTSYDKDGQKVEFTYDAFHRRMSKKTSQGEERYLYIGDNEIGSFDEKNSLKEFRLLAEGLGVEIGATVTIEKNSTPYACISDRRG